jgi:hypothetical protein
MLEFNQKFLNSGNFDFMYSSKWNIWLISL